MNDRGLMQASDKIFWLYVTALSLPFCTEKTSTHSSENHANNCTLSSHRWIHPLSSPIASARAALKFQQELVFRVQVHHCVFFSFQKTHLDFIPYLLLWSTRVFSAPCSNPPLHWLHLMKIWVCANNTLHHFHLSWARLLLVLIP